MTLKLLLIRDKNKQCRSKYGEGLKHHTHSENQLPNKSLDPILRQQHSDEPIARENDFKRIYLSIYQRCRQISSKAHEYRIGLVNDRMTDQYWTKGVLPKSHCRLEQITKLEKFHVVSFTFTKITNTTYEWTLTHIISKLLIAIT